MLCARIGHLSLKGFKWRRSAGYRLPSKGADSTGQWFSSSLRSRGRRLTEAISGFGGKAVGGS